MKITIDAPDYAPFHNADIARILSSVSSNFENKDEDEHVVSSTMNEVVYIMEDDWYLSAKVTIEV